MKPFQSVSQVPAAQATSVPPLHGMTCTVETQSSSCPWHGCQTQIECLTSLWTSRLFSKLVESATSHKENFHHFYCSSGGFLESKLAFHSLRILAKHYGMLKKAAPKKKKSSIFWTVYSRRWWTFSVKGLCSELFSQEGGGHFQWKACAQCSVLLTSSSWSPPNTVRRIYMNFNTHAFCDTAGRGQVAWYMVMLLPVVWDQFFSASVK